MMVTYARIEGGVVAELLDTEGDISKMFHPSLDWRDVSGVANIAPGWLTGEHGYVPPPEPPDHIVPTQVTMRQAREALIRRGMLQTVESYLAGMAGIQGELARNEWSHSQVVERNRPLTLAMAQVLGIAIPEELDELFIFAATL